MALQSWWHRGHHCMKIPIQADVSHIYIWCTEKYGAHKKKKKIKKKKKKIRINLKSYNRLMILEAHAPRSKK